MIVAIDGPAGAGKSTVARKVAMELGMTYLDTGAMYRAAAWMAFENGIDTAQEEEMVRLAAEMQVKFTPLTPDGQQRVYVNGQEVTQAIRTPKISLLTSDVSALPALRKVIVQRQREIGEMANPGVVLEGRDIGTVVFPNADVKIFLTASAEVRARRRHAELRERGVSLELSQVLAEQQERDRQDSERVESPLKAAEDAQVLSTDGLTIPQVVERIVAFCRERIRT